MDATLSGPELRLLAPAFAVRFARIIADLVAVIARGFLRNPKLVPLILPLVRRLNRTTSRLATLMAGIGGRTAKRSGVDSGRGASPTVKGPRGAPRERCRAPKPPIPTAEAWLVTTLRHEAAGYAAQLSHLLNEPGMPELLAATPAAGHLLRPLCRMLGISATALCPVAGDRCAPSRTTDTPPRGVASPATGVFPFKNPESPDTPPRGVASPAAGVFAFKNPESALAPSRTEIPAPAPAPHPPPCPRLRRRWPFFPGPQAKPA